MPRHERRKLKLLVRRHRAPHSVVQRARIILLAHQGLGTEQSATQLGCSSRNVRKWKARFSENPFVETLEDQDRSGRPAQIPVEIRCKLVQIACERPADQESPAPFRDIWTYESLAQSLEEQTGYRLSVSEVGRILRFEKIRPHRIRQWLKSSDPKFLPKAKRICRLYIRPPKNSVVLCVDEKPMQVLERKHPTHVDPRDGSIRYEYEYKRHGTQCLLAAFNVKTGSVFGRVVPHRTANALVSFMNALARRYPKKKIYVVWDNLNTHYDGKDERWKKFNKRHGGRFRFVYTPIHASWMNQVEIWFSILERRILKHGDFASRGEQAERVMGFIKHWNQAEGHPFRWTWRTDKLQKRKHNAA
ncbi:MAG: IS630 family transposase [Gammaproteobacteria bacterium]|nr:IS630 family transposase [Gammaproteobacteria bacterium]